MNSRDDPDTKETEFLLEKTYNSFFEAGAKAQTAFVSAVGFAVTAAFVIQAKSAQNVVEVPIVSLLLPRRIAAIAFLVLSSGSYLSLNVYWSYERWLGIKLKTLLRRRFGHPVGLWSLHHPSYFSYANLSHLLGRRDSVVALLLALPTALVPAVIYDQFRNLVMQWAWDMPNVLGAASSAVLVIVGILVHYRLTPNRQATEDEAEVQVQRLEDGL